MAKKKTPVTSLVDFFLGRNTFSDFGGIEGMRRQYHWKGRNYKETIEYKQYLNKKWRDANGDQSERLKVAKEIVKDWGGIHNNEDTTLRKFCLEIDSMTISDPDNRTSSRITNFTVPSAQKHPKRVFCVRATV